MKSSGPVFTRQNPFPAASRVGKAHYHPSCNQSLSKKKKKTTLSPVRCNQRSSLQSHTLSPESQELFEKKGQKFATTDGQPVFTETWPATECGSSPTSSTTSCDMDTFKQCARSGNSTVSSGPGVQQDSVLAKYIDRFRHGRPQSREERQQMPSANEENKLPFWWMSPSSLSHSSTPTKTKDKNVIKLHKDDRGPGIYSPAEKHQHDRSLSPCRGSLSILSDTLQGEFEDTEILHLQEKASRLLLRGECTLSEGSIPVSSEGLGSSDFSSPVSADEPGWRPLIPSFIKSTAKVRSGSVQAVSSQKSSVTPSVVPPKCREEDILFQWRLRRKMEQAREEPPSLQHSSLHGPTFSWQASSISYPSASGQVYKHKNTQPPDFLQKDAHLQITAPQPETKEAHGSCPPTSGPPPFPAFVVSSSSVSHPQAIAHVPAHMHLLCDVLPCPIQSSHSSTQQNILQDVDASQTKVVCNKGQVHGNSVNTFTDEPFYEHMPAPPSASSEALGRAGHSRHKRPERNHKAKAQTSESEKKTAPSTKLLKKSTRCAADRDHSEDRGSSNRSSSHQGVPNKVILQQERSPGFPTESCTVNAPPPSPVHRALGQVVSEVLFPSVDSSPAQRPPHSWVSPPSSASPQLSVPPCNAQNSMEVISQLLQEAEDSDEKEFEDDPLLQVLRKQRKWIKEQISEVDSALSEFQDQQHVD